MSKELTSLQALENIKAGLFGHCRSSYLKDTPEELEKVLKIYDEFFDIIEKALKENKKLKKVLEIIRGKRVDIHNLIYSSNVEEYNKFAVNYNQELCNTLLTREEYDLLKEVLL